MSTSKYSIEVVDPNGKLLADLAGRASNRRIEQSRNEAEVITWSVDLLEFERYCALMNQDPSQVFVKDRSEVRVKRTGTAICGGQLKYGVTRLGRGAIDLKATGFLNLFMDRYTGTTPAGTVQESFAATQKTTIATTLITQSQALTNGDFGVTIGPQATVGTGDKTYALTNIKRALQALTTNDAAPFDFEFTHDKIFKTYAQMGSQRPDIVFEWPGNIIDGDIPDDGTGIANQIIALGQGFGDQAQTRIYKENTGSQITYQLRQKVIMTNGSDDSDGGITDAANAELSAWAFPYELPTIKVDGNRSPVVTDYGIGDYVMVKIGGHQSLRHINRLYRVERRIIDIDENDNESVELYLSA